MLVHGQAVVTHIFQPIDDVAPPIAARGARRAADRQVHATTGQVQVLGDLAAGLTGADHQHLAGRQRLRVAVLRRVKLRDGLGQPLGPARNARRVVPAGRDHDLLGEAVAGAGRHVETALRARLQANRRDPFAQRRLKEANIVLEVPHDLVLQHEPMRIGTAVREPGQPTLPVGRDQAEGIPAVLAPLVPDAVLLQHDVLDPALLQAVAHRQPGLATADHHDVVVRPNGRRISHGHVGSPPPERRASRNRSP
jgi:hypothetical protein